MSRNLPSAGVYLRFTRGFLRFNFVLAFISSVIAGRILQPRRDLTVSFYWTAEQTFSTCGLEVRRLGLEFVVLL
jgi:hypothetical protein